MSQRASWAAGCVLSCFLVFWSLVHPCILYQLHIQALPSGICPSLTLPAEATVSVTHSLCPLRSGPACCLCISSLHLQSMCRQLVPSWFLWSRVQWDSECVRSADRSRMTQAESSASFRRLYTDMYKGGLDAQIQCRMPSV